MVKTYQIEVDCAHCASEMERVANTVSGVKSAVVNFMMLNITVEFEDGANELAVMKAVKKACKVVEDDCEIYF